MQELSISYFRVSDLTANSRNARTHSRRQIRQLKNSMETFGFTNPLLVDEAGVLIAGHGRLLAARDLEMNKVPVIVLEHLTEAQKRALMLADNKLALNAGWDEEVLAKELGELLAGDLAFSIETTGFSIAEVDLLIEGQELEEEGNPADDILPEQDKVAAQCAPGDIWRLGPHRLICGDARSKGSLGDLMDGQKARMVFTDPPYNVRIDGHVGGSGKIKHREFAMASGEMSTAQFTCFLKDAFINLANFSTDGSIHFIFMDWRHQREILTAGGEVYTELKNLIVWVKDNGGMGTFYRSRHELIFAFKNGHTQHVNSFELGQHGRYRTNIWEYRGVNSRRAGRMEDLAMHPTVKPVQMIADAIKDVSGRGDIVLDLFAGSGSTLIAAHKTGRRAFVCEFDAVYCDRIIARWEAYAKDDAERLVCCWPRVSDSIGADQ